jgi:lipopolysaccharide/colanic/teichoic acid biosynthesis glycosyltransferase
MSKAAKRAFDLTASLLGLCLLAPLLLLIGALVVLLSGRPALFRQERVGRGGQGFLLVKFRTMTVDATAAGGAFEAGQLRRVTSIGRLLRRTKLDELPQLWNVLKGDMSVVGPRPEVRKWVEAYPQRWAQVLTVRPGLTDPASIVYRNEEALLAQARDPEQTYREVILPHKLDLYEAYVRRQRFWGDLRIILKTVATVLTR